MRRGGPAKGEVIFTFVTDEESLGPNGMYFLRDKGIVKPDILLLGAPTDNSLIITERGVLWVEVTTTGCPAHAGQPEDGDNAVTNAPAMFSTAIGVSDGRYFTEDDIEIVNFGPGIGSEGHASNESVSIESLTTSALILDEAFDNLIGYSI